METIPFEIDAARSGQPALPPDTEATQPRAWEMIEDGRYQPRRIKGSCLGRELG